MAPWSQRGELTRGVKPPASSSRSKLASRRHGLLLASALGVALPSFTVRADDWQVSRSEFDPRLLAPLKAELHHHPDDLALLRRLMALYRKHSTLDKLVAELVAQAEKSGASADYYLAAQCERERGRFDEAARLLQTAATRPGGIDAAKLALQLAELALKHAPPDLQTARRHLEGALPALKAGEPRRKILHRLVDLYAQSNESAAEVQALRELLATAQGAEALDLRRQLAETLAHAGKVKESLVEWQHLASNSGLDAVQRAQTELHVGEMCESTQDDLGAIAAYRKGLALLPTQHYLRRELYEHLITLHRKRDELPLLLTQLEKEWPAASRSFADWELLGRLYDERGDTPSATAAYRSALRKNPHSIDVRRRLIAILERSGATSEVLHEYEQLIASAPGDSRAYLELAERLDKSGQRQPALSWLRRAATRFAGDPSLHSALADIYQRWGEADLALAEAELLVRLDPHDESYVVNLGEMYWARGRKEKADEVWRRLLTIPQSRTLGQARLADVYAEHNLMPQATELYQKAVRAEPNNLQLRRGLALCSERLSRAAEAVRHWEQIYFAAKEPSDRPLRLESRQHLGRLLHREARLQAPLYTWQRRLQGQLSQKGPDKLSLDELVALGLLVADVTLQLGQIDEAASVLVQLQKRLPEGPLLAEVLLALVPVYHQQHKLDEAIAALKRAAALLPDRKRELYAQLAELSLQGYHDEDAVHYAQNAVVDAPGELRLGEIFERRDDVNAAMAAYKRAIELDSRLFRAQMSLARLHLGRGELAEAATIYRDVVRRAPQEELVLEAGRKAIDLHEYLNTLPELLRELTPLAYAPVPKPVYRKLLLVLYERYATPLVALARSGDAAAQAELHHLGQGSLKPLAETLVEGDSGEQRLAVTLLGVLYTPGAAPALLNLIGVAPGNANGPRKDDRASVAPRIVDIDLRVDALLAAARLEDPRALPALLQLAQSREKHIRLGALYGLVRLSNRLDKSAVSNAAVPSLQGIFETASADASPMVKALGFLGLGELSAPRGLNPRIRAQLQSAVERRRNHPEEIEELAAAAAVHALGRAHEPSSVPILIDLLREGDDEAQRQAAWALGNLGDARALGPLLRAVFVKSEPVRQAATLALEQLTTSPVPVPRPATTAEPRAPEKLDHRAPSLPPERRSQDGLDVARWLADMAVFPAPPAGPPLWAGSSGAEPLVAALDGALQLHHDIALRTLTDLLGEKTGAAASLSLGPLTAPPRTVVAPPALLLSVAQGLKSNVTRLARGQSVAGAASDPAVRDLAILVLAKMARLDDPALGKDAVETLLNIARTDAAPLLVLRAAEALAALPEVNAAAILDRLLERDERWVRLAALDVAARPGAARFLSDAVLRKAAEDRDGFVREAATQLIQKRGAH